MSDTQEVAKPTPILSEEQLTDIKSFDDAIAMLAQAGIETTSVTDYGDGFMVLDKEDFVNVPFVILDYKVIDAEKSDFGAVFVVVRLVTKDGRKAIITDGSTGVCQQIVRLSERNPPVTGGLYCEKGFVVSEYKYVDDKGQEKPAKTFYIHGL